jgi:O-antigen ligase
MLGVLLLLGALWLTGRRGARWAMPAAAAIAAGIALAVVLSLPGWLARVDHTTTGSLDDVTLGRVRLAMTSLEIIRDHPLGVGTHRYLEVLDDGYLEEGEPGLRVHNFTLLIAAELGIAAALLLTALLVATGVQAIREGPWQSGMFLVLAPFLLFDVLYYDRSVGLLIFMVWLGALAAARRNGQPTSLASTSS